MDTSRDEGSIGLKGLLAEQTRAWQAGERRLVEEFLGRLEALRDRTQGLAHLIFNEYECRRERGEQPPLQEFQRRFPQLAEQLAFQFELHRCAEHALREETSVPGYVLGRELGRGGSGVVYEAWEGRLGRRVALKRLLPGLGASAELSERFLREARALAQLNDPHIVQVYHVSKEGQPQFIALEFVDGPSLKQALEKGPWPPREAAVLLEGLARAIQKAHDKKLVHRDLKPSNVLLSGEGVPKIGDFGLVKHLEADEELTRLSCREVGTPEYMAPEQVRSLKDVGPCADVYSLGVILYEVLSGTKTFTPAPGESVQAFFERIKDEEPASLRRNKTGMPPELETIALRCLQKETRARYASAAEVADELKRFLAGEPILARPASPIEKAVKWARRRPMSAAFLGSGVAAGLLLLALSVFALYQWRAAVSERRDRALAQVNVLQNAAPAEVPVILSNLVQDRADVLPQLRNRHAEQTDPAKKARLALALLPVEPDAMRDDVVNHMLKAVDPVEVIVARDVLDENNHGTDLIEQLWKLADDTMASETVRFRALVGLAKFAQDDRRWQKAIPRLIEELLGRNSNPLHLGKWVEALNPMRDMLIKPLSVEFRDRTLERSARRDVAAQVLAVYAADRPETLCELLLDADATQHASLRKLLDAHREKVIQSMEAELAKQPDYWQDLPLNSAWQSVPPERKKEIEQFGGIVADRWALCQCLPRGRLQTLTEALRASGYRPLSVRPWAGEAAACEGDRVAVVWLRDGRDWKLETDLTARSLEERDSHWKKRKLIVAGVAAFASQAGVRYLGLWRQADEGETAGFHLNLQPQDFETGGMEIARVQALADKGKVHVTAVHDKRVGNIRKENNTWIVWSDEGKHAGHLADGDRLLLDVDMVPVGPPSPLLPAWRAELDKLLREESNQENDNLILQRGRLSFVLERDREAVSALDTFLARLGPASALTSVGKRASMHARRYRALAHARLGNVGLARRDLDECEQDGAGRAFLASTSAVIAAYTGDAAAGLKRLDEAVMVAPGNAQIAYDGGRAYSLVAAFMTRRQAIWSASLVASPKLAALAAWPRQNTSIYTDRALDLLRLAVSRGYSDFSFMRVDPDLESLRTLPGNRDKLAQLGLNRNYASVWSSDAMKQAEGLQGLSVEEHLRRCLELAAKGYRPVALSLAHLPGEKTPRAASVWHRPIAQQAREVLARRQATAAATLLVLKQPKNVWPLFRHSAYPTQRTWLLWRAGEYGSAPQQLIERLKAEKDTSAKRALILALGEYTDEDLPAEMREPLVKDLLQWYRDDADAGVHAAIGWLLRHKYEGPTARLLDWSQAKRLDDLDKELAGKKPQMRPSNQPTALGGSGPGAEGTASAGWYVNDQRQTMVVIKGPLEFRMGSPLWEADRSPIDERPHVRRIPRSYALAATSVTAEQWQLFLNEALPGAPHSDFETQHSSEGGGPIVRVSWSRAVQYCNWLSGKEGIPEKEWCYPKGIALGKPHPDHLRRTGYRLPTEAEWEYACKAGSQEARFFGSDLELLPRYAHFLSNSKDRTWPVGQKRPNDLGLFDTHGNVWTWCSDSVQGNSKRISAPPVFDLEDEAITDDPRIRDAQPQRGGSFISHARDLRASNRTDGRGNKRDYTIGLRVCRTLPLDFVPSPSQTQECGR
jgi:formylglycine-generating enzyme required for sulfatase activity